MTNLSRIDLLEARSAMIKQERCTGKLERADLVRANPGQTLPNQLGHRLRKVFETPDSQADAFESLLKQISSILP